MIALEGVPRSASRRWRLPRLLPDLLADRAVPWLHRRAAVWRLRNVCELWGCGGSAIILLARAPTDPATMNVAEGMNIPWGIGNCKTSCLSNEVRLLAHRRTD